MEPEHATDAAAGSVERPVDLTTCDQEPIHIPGAIQPHGILLAVALPSRTIIGASANLRHHFGLDPAALLGQPIDRAIDPASLPDVSTAPDTARLARLTWRGTATATLPTFLHPMSGGVLLEADLPRGDTETGAVEVLDPIEQASRDFTEAADPRTLCTRLAQAVRRMTGHDRVKVYRFAPDWSGEVIAEDRNGRLPSYLGLRFPPSDIPAQARALYARNPERQIPDPDYVPVPLLQASPDPIDLTDVTCRAVSPIHLEYLHNMDVGASMSVSILRDGTLWGLVACHHHTCHYVAPELRRACVVLAQLAALRLALTEQTAATRRLLAVQAIEAQLVQRTMTGIDYREALLREGNGLLDVLGATGFALIHGTIITTIGETPADEDMRALTGWLATLDDEVFATDHLEQHFPPANSWQGLAGLLAVAISGLPQSALLWFRPALVRTVTWAGDPSKPLTTRPGFERLVPRRSFEAWTDQVRGRSQPWGQAELRAAQGLRDVIVDMILRRSLELEAMNAKLSRTNEELEAFTYVASHDLNEPLRQIETFATLLERIFKSSGRAAPMPSAGSAACRHRRAACERC